MALSLVTLVGVFSLLGIGLVALLRGLEARICKHGGEEPPLVQSRVPILGHIIGLIRYGVSYFKLLRESNNMPIFTIFLASQKVYVVNSPALISHINRRQKLIDSNPPFLSVVMGRLFGLHGDDLAELLRNPSEKGSLRRESKVVEHSLLERGMAPLNEIFNNVMGGVAEQLNSLGREGPVEIGLETWLRDVFTSATATGSFGPKSPFDVDPSLLSSFWIFESGMKELVIGLLPSITAAGPEKARTRLIQAFMDFFRDESAVSGTCELIQQLRKVALEHNRGIEYLARYFFAVFCAFILNTVPVTFWTIAHIIDNPELLARIRAELTQVIRTESASGDRTEGHTLSFDVAALRNQCPLFHSTFREVIRYVGASRGIMVVHEDVVVDHYLLKKDAQVQISATAIHSDPEIWGPDAGTFNPERFLTAGGGAKTAAAHPAANRTFGGGSTLCPGRHLASDEIMALTAMFLCTFDTDFVGPRRLPARDETDMSPIVKPKGDLLLRLSRRADMENATWEIRK